MTQRWGPEIMVWTVLPMEANGGPAEEASVPEWDKPGEEDTSRVFFGQISLLTLFPPLTKKAYKTNHQ